MLPQYRHGRNLAVSISLALLILSGAIPGFKTLFTTSGKANASSLAPQQVQHLPS